MINCEDPYHPVMDYPKDYDTRNDIWNPYLLSIRGIAVVGCPNVNLSFAEKEQYVSDVP